MVKKDKQSKNPIEFRFDEVNKKNKEVYNKIGGIHKKLERLKNKNKDR